MNQFAGPSLDTENRKCAYHGKVLTNFTSLVIKNLNAYTIPYIFWKVLTSLAINELNPYNNDKVAGLACGCISKVGDYCLCINGHYPIVAAVCSPWLAWIVTGRRLLAAKLAASGPAYSVSFFPLWLGYILIVDALVCWRGGTSLWTRSRRGFVLLFFLSAPAWWLFEFINNRTGNWEYLGAGGFTPLEYNLLSTLCFSTVMPAVFETAELVRTFDWVKSLRATARIPDTFRVNSLMLLAGLMMLAATLLWPRFCYPFVWISIVLILEPLNHWLGRPHLLEWLARGDWRPIVSLALGALICGFFWEMWNEWSWPQWIYHTPGAEFLRIFKMPLPGYGGYIPFALELFALKNFLWPRGPKLEI